LKASGALSLSLPTDNPERLESREFPHGLACLKRRSRGDEPQPVDRLGDKDMELPDEVFRIPFDTREGDFRGSRSISLNRQPALQTIAAHADLRRRTLQGQKRVFVTAGNLALLVQFKLAQTCKMVRDGVPHRRTAKSIDKATGKRRRRNARACIRRIVCDWLCHSDTPWRIRRKPAPPMPVQLGAAGDERQQLTPGSPKSYYFHYLQEGNGLGGREMDESRLAHHEPRDPLHILSLNIFCAPPPKELTPEQLCALHEFFHEVLAAGYKLYQKVPIDQAAEVIREKFGKMCVPPPPRGASR
jgi:hypothetical protein